MSKYRISPSLLSKSTLFISFHFIRKLGHILESSSDVQPFDTTWCLYCPTISPLCILSMKVAALSFSDDVYRVIRRPIRVNHSSFSSCSMTLLQIHTDLKYIWNCTVHSSRCIVCTVPFNRVRTFVYGTQATVCRYKMPHFINREVCTV